MTRVCVCHYDFEESFRPVGKHEVVYAPARRQNPGCLKRHKGICYIIYIIYIIICKTVLVSFGLPVAKNYLVIIPL